jgi:hypothetical protein
MIYFHVALLAAVVVYSAACLAVWHGRPTRPPLKLFLAALPVWLIGSAACLTLSNRGMPLTEWLLPLASVVLIGLFCRSDRAFKLSRWVMPLFALALCVSFLVLIGDDYTASPDVTRKLVSRSGASVTKEWHTPMTRLYKIERPAG